MMECAVKNLLMYGIIATTLIVNPASAAFVLNNNPSNADGSVILVNNGFRLFGADNNIGQTITTYLGIAQISQDLTFNFLYTTNDRDGSNFDPAGYIINNVEFQLSPNSSAGPSTFSGSVNFAVNIGDSFGFYVRSLDSGLGRANILVTGDLFAGNAVPEPATWAMMIIGFGLTGSAMRRRRSIKVSYA
jgi:PEP-CTERM motif